jgi:hypothetical protein
MNAPPRRERSGELERQFSKITAQKPAMHEVDGSAPDGGQQSALLVQRSSRLAQAFILGGEQLPTGSTSSAGVAGK